MNKFYKGINDYFYKRLIKEEDVIYYEKESDIYLTDKYFIAIIPVNEFVLDKSKMKEVREYVEKHIKYECDDAFNGKQFYSYHLYDFDKNELLEILDKVEE